VLYCSILLLLWATALPLLLPPLLPLLLFLLSSPSSPLLPPPPLPPPLTIASALHEDGEHRELHWRGEEDGSSG